MTRVLVTAYGPYDDWQENASWLVLQALTSDLPTGIDLTTRLYPVDFNEVQKRMASDMAEGFDVALHLGQSPGSGWITFESIGVNVRRDRDQYAIDPPPLIADGPLAYRSELPLDAWAEGLRAAGVPARISVHAGAYLCNAALYLSHYFAEQHGKPTASTFVHLPLDPSQVIESGEDLASMPAQTTAAALRVVLESLPKLSLA